MVNGTTTGGAGGPTVTVTNGTDFNTQINIAGARIIQVQGPISIGRIFTTANKTILGLGTSAGLLGNLNLSGVSNVIIRNLHISDPGNDGLTIRENGALPGSHHIWVDHCTFFDCGDGACDMNNGAQYNTVSWCKFTYPTQLEHRFTMIADGFASGGVTNWGYYTLHHNWWSARCDQRMAASSYGRVHYYNNFFKCTNNSYCCDARCETEFASENNYYSGVKSPIYKECTGKIRTAGNLYFGTTGNAPDAGTDTVFTPPYPYTLDATADVPNLITNGAGAPGVDAVVFPAKVWDGGGADNNLNTANNWGYAGGYNETPKEYDVMVFAGGARLAPNNNIAANSEFAALNFSNNAGAFVLGGNTLNLGQGITNESAAIQTINLNLDFTYAADHYPTNRYFNVTAGNGSLVMNGRLAGTTNIYGKLYSVTKLGPGLLTLAGINTFPGNFNFNGGLVRFGALDTNVAGSLGWCTNLNFYGGGLQWAPGNAADVSRDNVTINSGGAVFDVGANSVTLADRIGNNGAGGMNKLGSGTLTFNATNSYKGDTLIAQGTLALGMSGLLANSPQIILSNNAVLDVSARSDGTLTLMSGRTLLGDGTVRGSVVAASGSTVAPGFSIGTLVITNLLTLQSTSTNLMELDAAAHTNDWITGMTRVTYGGWLIVTNLGGAFAAGDTFKLFSAGGYGGAFSSLTLPPLTGNLVWTNKLALDGTLAVISPVNTAPTNLTFAVIGNSLRLSWPANQLGWHLEAQTNALALGLEADWSTVAGSSGTNRVYLPIDPNSGCVLLRLAYP